MELVVVIVILGVALALTFPNYTTSTEQAYATKAENNLLAIYTAQQNYMNNHGSYCNSQVISPEPTCNGVQEPVGNTCGQDYCEINYNLGLNIDSDNTYTYVCSNGASTCTATRNRSSALAPTITLTLNAPIQLTGSAPNPICAPTTSNPNWCPQVL